MNLSSPMPKMFYKDPTFTDASQTIGQNPSFDKASSLMPTPKIPSPETNFAQSDTQNPFSGQSPAPQTPSPFSAKQSPPSVLSSKSNVASAQSLLGNNSYNGNCQQFVEQMTYGKAGIYPSAIDAAVAQQDKMQPGLDNAREGDLLYFSPNAGNGYNGHTGIYEGDGKFISATDNGVQELPVDQWEKATGQTLLGHVSTGDGGQNATG